MLNKDNDNKTITADSASNPATTGDASAIGNDDNNSSPFKPTLTVFNMVIYGLITMVPIAPMAIYGGIFEASNGMPAFALALGFIAVITCVLSFGTMIREFPSSGSIYTYATKSIGEPVGFIVGWLMIFQYIVSPITAYIMAGIALHGFIPEIPTTVFCLMFLAFIACVMLRGMQATVTVNRIALIAQLVILGIFVVVGIYYVNSHGNDLGLTTKAFINPEKFNFQDMMGAVSLAMLAYIGMGSIATLTQDAKNPKVGPPRAMLIMCLILLALFLLQTYIATCVDPAGANFKENSDNAFYIVAKIAGGAWLSIACAVMVALSQGVFGGLALQTSCSLLLYSIAKSGALPKFFAKTDKKTGLQLNAIIFTIVASFVLIFILQPLGLNNVVLISNFAAVATYVILNISVIAYMWFRKKSRHKFFRYLIMPLIGASFCTWILISMGATAIIIGLIWVVIGILYYCVLKFHLKRVININ